MKCSPTNRFCIYLNHHVIFSYHISTINDNNSVQEAEALRELEERKKREEELLRQQELMEAADYERLYQVCEIFPHICLIDRKLAVNSRVMKF